jgi:hypothetical protein
MKKYFFSLLIAIILPAIVFAQDDKTPKRPENIGVSDFDLFKNSSFDILGESTDLKTDATRLDTDVKSYAAGIGSVSVEKLKADYKAVRDIGKSSQELTAKIGSLDDQSKSLLEAAKNVKPMTKSPQATGNTNKSIKGLDTSKKNLSAVTTIVTDNTKLLADELKKRGEAVDED